MTNTHITVGGHKITTNKVGGVKNFTLSTATADVSQYCVINNSCYVKCWNLAKTTTGSSTIATGLPKPRFSCGITGFGGNVAKGFLYIETNGNLSYDCFVANSGAFVLFVYPVADDWVES